YCMNSPVNAIDIDGRLTIFINGFKPSERIVFLGLQSNYNPSPYSELRIPITYGRFVNDNFKTKDEYGWGGLDEFYKKRYNDPHALYVNGSDEIGSAASTRYASGMSKAKELIEKIRSGEFVLTEGEKIRLVGYSMGAAYAAGMASVLADSPYGSMLEFVDYIAPHQPTGFEHPADILGRQYGSKKDILSGKGEKIKNIDDINHHLGNFGSFGRDFEGHALGNNFSLNQFIMEVINNGGTVTVYN
ncbi:hypothetical protein LJC29_04605, partial [Bacteroides sp. OttesenSCG-928-N06]|nr:hypothetical protein [Bacteroides sp. OttesenSCG-928-N06]